MTFSDMFSPSLFVSGTTPDNVDCRQNARTLSSRTTTGTARAR